MVYQCSACLVHLYFIVTAFAVSGCHLYNYLNIFLKTTYLKKFLYSITKTLFIRENFNKSNLNNIMLCIYII